MSNCSTHDRYECSLCEHARLAPLSDSDVVREASYYGSEVFKQRLLRIAEKLEAAALQYHDPRLTKIIAALEADRGEPCGRNISKPSRVIEVILNALKDES